MADSCPQSSDTQDDTDLRDDQRDGQQLEDEAASDTCLPSCESCRKRKLKCSRGKPVCSNCERLDTLCVYELKRNKPGLKSGAVESLNRRLEVVERILINQDDQGPSIPDPTQHKRPLQASPQNEDSLGSAPVVEALSTLAQEIRKLSSVFSHQPRPPPSACHPQEDPEGGGPGHSRPSKRRRSNGTSPETISNYPQGFNIALDDIQDSLEHLPPQSLLPALLDSYFHRIQPWIAIVHEADFRVKLQKPGGLKHLSVIIHAMTVAALHFTTRHGHLLSAAEVASQQKKSRKLVILTAMDELSVENLQSLVILAFTDISNGNSRKAWPIIASLSRSVEYLQLSVESEGRQKRGALLQPLPFLPTPKSWVEEEERRRVFWNVFMLDRFCSITTGWNTSLTAADVCRRLPVCGGLWYKCTPAPTPYFGIWDQSAAKMGNSITFIPAHYPSPTHSTNAEINDTETPAAGSSAPHAQPQSPDMTNVGALAYNIESLESLSRINSYFLQQRVDFSNRKEVSSWLTRFKELDLRLVHWKMFLPQQWQDSGISRETMPGVMDPNMTAAHATHNTSMILLHQRIAYPGPELVALKLPTLCSAETCRGAAVETANITQKYLDRSPKDSLVSPQLALAAFVSARVLLIHSRFYGTLLATEFWVLVENLKEMSRRWTNDSSTQRESLFGHFAVRLQKLHEHCQRNPNFQIDISGCTEETYLDSDRIPPRQDLEQEHSHEFSNRVPRINGQNDPDVETDGGKSPASLLPNRPQPTMDGANDAREWIQPLTSTGGDELAAISQILMDQRFMEMDRVISFDDMMFTSRPSETTSASLDQSHSWSIPTEGQASSGLTGDGCPPIYWDQI